MTADIATQMKSTGPSTMLHNLTLSLAALTLLFALLSLIFGNRLTSLYINDLKAEKETIASESASIQKMETALNTAMKKVETVQKALNEEKAASERLRRQLAAVMKDLEKSKSDLASANQTISRLKSMLPVQSTPPAVPPESITTPAVAPSAKTVPPAKPGSQAATRASDPSPELPTPVEPPAVIPTPTLPNPAAEPFTVSPAGNPQKQAGTAPPASVGPQPSDPTFPGIEETITDTAPAPPSDAPATN